MRFNKFLIMCCFAILVAAPMFADLVVSSNATGTGFISGVTPTVNGNNTGTLADANQSGLPYWDHGSQDSNISPPGNCGIGYIVNKTFTGANCANLNGNPLGADDPAALSYWAKNANSGAQGNYDPNFMFTNASAQAAEFEISLAGNGAGDQFGYFDAGGMHLIATAASTPETVMVVIPAGDSFGFYLTSPSGITYKTNDNGIQHFTLFSADNAGTANGVGGSHSTNNYYIGAEDNGPSGLADGSSGFRTDFDYQDVVVHISAVPEPGSLPVLVTGLAGMALILRRRFQAKK